MINGIAELARDLVAARKERDEAWRRITELEEQLDQFRKHAARLERSLRQQETW